MKLVTLFLLASKLVFSKADDGYVPGDNFSTFTPTDGYLEGATTQFTTTFGIAINPIVSSVQLSSVTTEADGNVYATQINDGQIQAATSTPQPQVMTQIGDGQIQGPTPASPTFPKVETMAVVTQIGDGQIQATTLTTVNRPVSSSTSESDNGVVTTKITKIIKAYVTVPASSSCPTSSDDVITTYTVTPTDTVIQTITSLNLPTLLPTTVLVNKRESEETATLFFSKRELPLSCSSDTALSITLEDSVLRDSHGRIGAIVANRQFQFDGPPPQAGSIYAAGWSIVDGKLALGKVTTFYQCLSGNFYNVYDQSVGPQCTAVELDIVIFQEC